MNIDMLKSGLVSMTIESWVRGPKVLARCQTTVKIGGRFQCNLQLLLVSLLLRTKKAGGGTSRSWNGHLFDTVDIDLMDVASDLVYFMFCNTSSIYSTEKHFFFCKHESNLHLYIWYNHKLYPFGFITLQFRTPVRESLPFLCLCMHIHIIVLKQ